MIVDDKFYVKAVLKNNVVIFCQNSNKTNLLKGINAKKRWFNKSIWDVSYKSKEDLATIFNELNKIGAAFSFDQHGWGPSCMFLELKDRGLIEGNIYEIAWTGGGKYRITIR